MLYIPNDYTFHQHKMLALFHQAVEIYGKFYTSDSLLETVLYWRINCRLCLEHRVALEQTGMS